MCPGIIIWRQEFLRITLLNLLQSFFWKYSVKHYFLKVYSRLLAHKSSFIEFFETVSFRELRLIFPRGLHVPRVLDAYEIFVVSARLAGEGRRQKPAVQQQLFVFESLHRGGPDLPTSPSSAQFSKTLARS